MELGGMKEIFLRGLKRMDEIEIGYDEYVFFKIDIGRQDSGTTLSPCCPSLLNKISRYKGTMVHLGGSSIVYIICAKWNPLMPIRKGEEVEANPDSIGGIACVQDAGWIDLSEKDPIWRSAPCPTHNVSNPLCVPLSGQIYSLGNNPFKLEVYNHPDENNNNGGCWVELPHPPREIISDKSYVFYNPIPDPEHDRMVVHVNPESAIYSFEPNNNNTDNQWKRLSPPGVRFIDWSLRAAIVDGVVFFSEYGRIRSIVAFDLADSMRLLKIEWSDSDGSKYPEFMREIEFDVLLNLGNGFLCFALYTPLYNPREIHIIPPVTRVYFVLLSVKRQTPGSVTFTYHYFREYDLPETVSVADYVVLGGE